MMGSALSIRRGNQNADLGLFDSLWELEMKYAALIPFLLLSSTSSFAQPSIQIGPGGVQIDPGGPREERIVREEGDCRVTIIRRTDERGRRTVRRIRECDEDDEE
jgi:hypothetical protein